MHFTANWGSIEVAVRNVRDGNDLGGLFYHTGELLGALVSAAIPGPWRIENAILSWDPTPNHTSTNLPRELPVGISFRNCTFYGKIGFLLFDHLCYHKLEIYDCTSIGPFKIQSCNFNQIVINNLTTQDELRIQDCTCSQGFPSVEDCRFSGPVWFEQISVNRKSPNAELWEFRNCDFQNDATISPTVQPASTQFSHCIFGSGCHAEITIGVASPMSEGGYSHDLPDIRFESTQVNGRVRVKPHIGVIRDARRRISNPSEDRRHVWVVLRECVVTGELDLSRLRLHPLDLTDTSFSSGKLSITLKELRRSGDIPDRLLARVPILSCPPDRYGNLWSEQLVVQSDTALDEGGSENPYFPVAAEYGELRNAFSRVPEAIEHEEYCHYKFREYRRQAQWWNIRKRGFGRPEPLPVSALPPPPLAPSLPTGTVGLANTTPQQPAPQRLNRPIEQFVATVAEYTQRGIGWLRRQSRRQARPASATHRSDTPPTPTWTWSLIKADAWEYLNLGFDRFFWKWMLGYGMYARRVLTTAVGVILLCTCLYAWGSSSPNHSSWWGYVEAGDGKDGKTVYDDTDFWVTLRQTLYFSTVTFTTLGYGDFTPKGRLQYVAAAEALSGGVLIAFLTVVYARKFIR